MGIFDFLSSKKEAVVASKEVSISDLWLSSIVSELTDAVVAYDEEFRVLIFNKAAEQIFELPGKDVVGSTLSISGANDPQLQLLTRVIFPSLAPSVVTRSAPGVYPQIVDLHFDEAYLRVTTNRIIDHSGALQGFVKIIRDRTRESEILRSKSEFLTVAAHQLRTPLAAINWVFEGLNHEAIPPAATELVSTGALAGKKLLKIVDDLLDVAKLEGGKFGYAFQEGDLIAFIDRLLADATVVAKTYKVNMYFEHVGVDALPLKFDAQKLGLAFSNLIDNAVKYNVPNGSITVSVSLLTDQPYALITIKDTGVGVPPEALPKLFSKFFRAENVMKFATEGSGLGLYLVKNIIQRHGGKIWVESVINRGTTFSFVLPTDPSLIPQKEMIVEEDL